MADLNTKLTAIAKKAIQNQQAIRSSRSGGAKVLDAITNTSYTKEDQKAADAALRKFENEQWKPKTKAYVTAQLSELGHKPGSKGYQEKYDYLFNQNYKKLQTAKAQAQQRLGTLRKPGQTQRQLDNVSRYKESKRDDTEIVQRVSRAGRDSAEAVSGGLATGFSRTRRALVQTAADIGENDDGGIFDRAAKGLEAHEENLQKVYPGYGEAQQGSFAEKVALGAVENIPQIIALGGAAGAAGKAAQLLGAGKKASAVAAYGATSASIYPMAYLDGNDSIKDELDAVTPDQLKGSKVSKDIYSENFNKNIQAGLDEATATAKARDQTVSKLAEIGGNKVGLATILTSLIAPGVGSQVAQRVGGGTISNAGSKIFNRLAVRADSGKVARIAVPAAAVGVVAGLNAVEEGVQEGYTDYVAQKTAVDVGVKDKIDQAQNNEAVLLGATLGGLFGGSMSIAGSSRIKTAQAQLGQVQDQYAQGVQQSIDQRAAVAELEAGTPEFEQARTALLQTQQGLSAMKAEAEKIGIPFSSLSRRAPRIEPTDIDVGDIDLTDNTADPSLGDIGAQDPAQAQLTDPGQVAADATPVMSDKERDAQDAQIADLIAEQNLIDEAIQDGSNERSVDESIEAANNWYAEKRGANAPGLAGVVARAKTAENDEAVEQGKDLIAGNRTSINDYIADQRAQQAELDAQANEAIAQAETPEQKEAIAAQREAKREQENETLGIRESLALPYDDDTKDWTVTGADGAPFNLGRMWNERMGPAQRASAIDTASNGELDQNLARADWQSIPEGIKTVLHNYMTDALAKIGAEREAAKADTPSNSLSLRDKIAQPAYTTEDIKNDIAFDYDGTPESLASIQSKAETAGISQADIDDTVNSVISDASWAQEDQEEQAQPLDANAPIELTEQNPVINIPAPGQKAKSVTPVEVPAEAEPYDIEKFYNDFAVAHKNDDAQAKLDAQAKAKDAGIDRTEMFDTLNRAISESQGPLSATLYQSKPAARAAIKRLKIKPKSVEILDRDGGFIISDIKVPEVKADTSDRVASNTTIATGKDGNAKWFGSEAKAQDFVAKKSIGDTHEVVSAGKSRFEIQPKAKRSTGKPLNSDEFADLVSNRSTSMPTGSPTADTETAAQTETKGRFADNKLFSEDKVAAARARLKSKRGQLNSGLDPEILIDGVTLAGAYIESGVRKFGDYAKLMIEDIGSEFTPYLLMMWNGVRDYPGLDVEGMTNEVDSRAEFNELMEKHKAASNPDNDVTPAPQKTEHPQKLGSNGKELNFIGENNEGVPIYEDDRGVRAIPNRGFLESEPVSINPGANTIEVNNRREKFKTTQELTEGNDNDTGTDNQNNQSSVDAGLPTADQATAEGGSARSAKKITTSNVDAVDGDSAGSNISRGNGDTRSGAAPKQADAVDSDSESGGARSDDGSAKTADQARQVKARNHSIDPADPADKRSWYQVAENNVSIIELLKTLDQEGRTATASEQALLSQYAGWGASEIANGMFANPETGEYKSAKWRELGERLKSLLSDSEYDTARRTTQYAHYTPPVLVEGIYKALDKFGFKGGSVLEPASGVGVFNGLMPSSMASNSNYVGIELDPTTGRIAQHLYPQSDMKIGDFIKAKLPGNHFDAAVGNPPFANISTSYGTGKNKSKLQLHDFFFAKTLDQLKEGGVMAFVTSKGTMDKGKSATRELFAQQADLIGAIRLPQTAFKENAGTEVVTDIIFLRKRMKGEKSNGIEWMNTAEVDINGQKTSINEYFANNPDMVLGTNAIRSSQFGPTYTVEPKAGEFKAQLDKAIDTLPSDIYNPAPGSKAQAAKVMSIDYGIDNAKQKEGGTYLKDGQLMRVVDGVGKPLTQRYTTSGEITDLKPKDIAFLTDYVGLRDALKRSQRDQLEDSPNWEDSLAELNTIYDAFVDKHGRLMAHTVSERVDDEGKTIVTKRFTNKARLFLDAEGALASALENVEDGIEGKNKGIVTKGSYLQGRSLRRAKTPVLNTVQDALIYVLDTEGGPNIERIAELINKTQDQVIADLGDQIYLNPTTGVQELAETYLSGNVVQKLAQAEDRAKTNKNYSRNVKALREIQPKPIAPNDIASNLGAAWIPGDVVGKFGEEVLGANINAAYSKPTGLWDVSGTSGRTSDYSTPERSTVQLVESILNSKKIVITYKVGEETFTDTVASELANTVAKKIKAEFKKWLWSDGARAQELADYYNKSYNNIVPPKFNGKHLTLAGTSNKIKLTPHQLTGVYRVISQGDVYLNHAVGAGKTFTMIASAMEEKRLGLINKPMFVVPNHMLDQFSQEFLLLYPAANIMVADEKNFDAHNRQQFVAQAALNKPDAIIITHSAFKRIGVKPETENNFVQAEIDKWKDSLTEVKAEKGDTRTSVKQMERNVEAMETRLKALANREEKDNVVFFEDIGVDKLYIDEMHEFRKLSYVTKKGNIKGIDPSGSQMATDLNMKLDLLRSEGSTRTLVGASGTPITNTMGELFSVQRYFQPKQLDTDGLDHFDSWANQFGEVVEGLEQNAAGNYEVVPRFAKFVNVPELMSRIRTFMDVLTSQDLGDVVKRPDVAGGGRQIVAIPTPDGFSEYQQKLSDRIDAIRKSSGKPEKGDDIILSVIGDGRFSAIDMRFVDPTLPSDPNSKLNIAIADMAEAYHATADNEYHTNGTTDENKGGGLMMFTDIGLGEQSAKNRGFDMKAWINSELIRLGVEPDHIAFMRDNKSHAKKGKLFDDMRQGKKRIMIGGKDMETGVNAQKRLTHLFHLDAPWFPASVEQREGRIIRQGNQNKEVVVRAYATKGSYDSTMWGMIARKSRFIEQAMSGDATLRNMDDVSEASSFEQASALSSGDPRALQLAGLRQDVERLNRLYSAHQNGVFNNRSLSKRASQDLQRATRELNDINALLPTHKTIATGDVIGTVGKKAFDNRKDYGQAIIDAFKKQANESTVGEVLLGKAGNYDVVYNGVSMSDGTFYADANINIPKADDKALFDTDNVADARPDGLTTRIVNRVEGLAPYQKKTQGIIEQLKSDIENFDRRSQKSFDEETELSQKAEELAELEATLSAEAEQLKNESSGSVAFTEADAVPESKPKYSKTNKAKGTTGTTAKQVIDALQKRFGKDAIAKLIKSGKLRIRTLDNFVSKDGRLLIAEDAEGIYHNGTVTLIADNLTSDTIIPTLLHEMGGHAGIQGTMSENDYMKIMKAFDRLVESGNKTAVKARDRALASTDNETDAMDEYIPYLISEQSAATQKQPAIRKLMNQIVAAVRKWLRDTAGVNLPLTPNDIEQLAEKMIKRLADENDIELPGLTNYVPLDPPVAPQSEVDAVRKQHEGKASWMKAPNGSDTKLSEQQWLQVRTPAFKQWFGDWENDPDNASHVVDSNGEPLLITKTTSLESVNNSSSTDTESSANTVIGESGLSHIDSLVYVPLNTGSSSRSGDTELIKPSSNSGLPTLEYGGYFVRAIPIPPEVDKVGASNVIPSLMDRGVLRQGNDLKIGGFVVKPIVVNVMDVLGSQQTSSDGFFNNDPVLKNLLSIDRNNFISIPKGASTHSNVVAVAPTKEAFIPSEFASMDREWRTASSAGNLVHIDLPNGYYVVSIARNKDNGATQIKSANDNTGAFDANNNDIRYSRRYSELNSDTRPTDRKGKAIDAARLAGAAALSSKFYTSLLLRRHVATPQHVALLNPSFKVFHDNVQARIAYENNEAGAIQGHLPEIWDTRLRVGKKKEAMDKVSRAYFDGTMADVVWTDDQLQQQFNLDENEVSMYKRAREATNQSVKQMTADVLSALAKGTKLVNIHTVNALKLQGLMPLDHNDALKAHMIDALQVLAQSGSITPAAEARMQDHLNSVFDVMQAVAGKYQDLVDKGYAPLMRFGHYAVEVRNKDTNELDLFELYESKGAQNKAVKDLKKKYDLNNFSVGTGTLNPEGFKQFTDKGLSPETVQLFASELGLDSDGAIQAYLKVAISDRSALKRLIHRKKVPGYSEDLPRVMSSFVMSNARYSGRSLYNGEIEKSIQVIKDGNLQGEAQSVFDNMENPKEEYATVRGLLFHYFMGFSFAFLTLNLTQPVTQTIPKLTAYVGVVNAHKDMVVAVGIVNKYLGKAAVQLAKKSLGISSIDWQGFENNLPSWVEKEDYLKMSREGHLDPQNIWMIRGLERGKDSTLSGVWGNIERMAGWPAEISETINRRSTMIAAFQAAKRMGDAKLKEKGFDSAYDFAVSVIQQTQGVYNKGNRSGLARGNGKLGQFGPLVLVFKQFTINYTEQMLRHGKDKEVKSLAVAMTWQFMLAGMLGLPFADDLRDIIEGMLYRIFGRSVNFVTFLEDELGKETADALMFGIISEKSPVDFYGRSSLGNILPGTDFARPKQGDWKEILGASSGFFENFFTAGQHITKGQYKDAVLVASPRYVRDAASGIEIGKTGAYRNQKGDKVMDMSKSDAIIKGVFQFNPSSNAKQGRNRSEVYNMKGAIADKTTQFSLQLAEAIYQEDYDKEDKVYEELEEWNESNADQYYIDPEKVEKSADRRLDKKDFTSDERQTVPDALGEYLEGRE